MRSYDVLLAEILTKGNINLPSGGEECKTAYRIVEDRQDIHPYPSEILGTTNFSKVVRDRKWRIFGMSPRVYWSGRNEEGRLVKCCK